MAQTKKKQTPINTPLEGVPPTPTTLPVDDDPAPIGFEIIFSESSEAFLWLESLADLLRVAAPGDLCDTTIRNTAWLMQEIAGAGHSCWSREWEETRKRLIAAGAIQSDNEVTSALYEELRLSDRHEMLMRQLKITQQRERVAVAKRREAEHERNRQN